MWVNIKMLHQNSKKSYLLSYVHLILAESLYKLKYMTSKPKLGALIGECMSVLCAVKFLRE